jgi:hypothetical protein
VKKFKNSLNSKKSTLEIKNLQNRILRKPNFFTASEALPKVADFGNMDAKMKSCRQPSP